MNYPELSKMVQDHVQSLFRSQKDKTLIYHNITHTENVVKATSQIANHYQLNERDFFVVTTAAWFHDIGYLTDYKNHEERGGEMASAFLRNNFIDEETIQSVVNCILATRVPQNPKNKLDEIVCDADLFHLGTDDFAVNNKLMRKETETKKGINISKDEWRNGTILLFEMHNFFTDYCQLLLNDRKRENLEKLRNKALEKEGKSKDDPLPAEKTKQQEKTKQSEKAKQFEKKEPVIPVIPLVNISNDAAHNNTQAKKKKDEKSKRPERGIETMFRITSGNNQRLSDMADNKAHIMITVNSIILSAIISLLLRKLEEYNFLRWPTYLILAVCVMTIIFSIIATRPSLPGGRFTEADIEEKKVNLLFFGNFYRMNLTDYAAGMLQVMNDRDFLYGTLIKDVYSQGVVLGRKFRLLRISYNIFMYGLIASVLAFVAATIFEGK